MKNTTKLLNIENHKGFLELTTDGAKFRIYLLDENLIRVRGTFDDEFAAEESYALIKTAWDDKTDKFMADERTRVEALPINLKELTDHYEVEGPKYKLSIYREPFYLQIEDYDGHVLHKDVPKRSYVLDNNNRRIHYTQMGDKLKVYI